MDEVFLQCFDDFSLKLNLNNRKIVKDFLSITTTGWYSVVQNKISALCLTKTDDYLLFGDVKIVIKENFNARWVVVKDQNVFELFEDSTLILSFSYFLVNGNDLDRSNLFGFVEQEDFNWGGFLSNLINDRERRNLIKANLRW